MKKQIIIGNLSFNTQKEIIEYVRNLLPPLVDIKSIKNEKLDTFSFLMELCKRHFNYDFKFQNFQDFRVVKNAMNKKAFELNIINNDNTTISISWRDCISGKITNPRTLFTSALRECISQQILDFKNVSDLYTCTICNCSLSDKNIHIDHYEPQFSQIVNNFLELNKDRITYPETYTSLKPTNQTKFKDCDKWIGDLFSEYHFINASLRVSCEHCNLTRPKAKNINA